ncbi:MAG: hypothetical protein IPK74_03030 [Deltaproteobacteria bacterium]|nr:hypothetical protein [Deltaproteobacteria bacterium]
MRRSSSFVLGAVALACAGPDRDAAPASPTSSDATGTSGGSTTVSGSAGTGSATTEAGDTNGATIGDTTGDDGASSSGGAELGVPMFVAQGMVGRTTVSCDDGLTWIGERSWDVEGDAHLCGSTTPVDCSGSGSTCTQRWFDGSCSEEACDCGHSPGFSKGVEHGAGRFVATWGWGWPGAVATSTNGFDWQTTLDGDTFGGLRYGGGRFVVASRTPQTSLDGITWTASQEADFHGDDGVTIWSVRRFGFADVDGGRFVAYASGDTSVDTLISSDGGGSWWRPRSMPSDCLGEGPGAYGDIIAGNGVIVMVDGDGHACRSDDGGSSWTAHTITDSRIASSGVWTGDEFWFWGFGSRYSSADGITWTTTPIDAPDDIGPVARSPEGTLVAVNNVWLGYEQQAFLRSTDGVTWASLPDGDFTPGHPIFFIAFGHAEPSAMCPGT